MKCIFKDCEEDAILGSNYCTEHKKKGGFINIGRFKEKFGFGFEEEREELAVKKSRKIFRRFFNTDD